MKLERISIIGIVGVPAKYGGFETLVENTLDYFCKIYDVTVYCSGKSYISKISTYKGAKIRYINFKPNGIQSIFYDIFSIIKAVKYSEKILLLGVSGAIAIPFFNKKCKFITNIDGLEWKRNKWNFFTKKILKYLEGIAVKYSHIVISDNKAITDYVYKEYNRNSTLISYGGDHTNKIGILPQDFKTWSFLENQYFFTVCRIEPENNIDLILEAFSKIGETYVVIGNWDYSAYGRDLKLKYKRFSNLNLLNPIYDLKILDLIRSNCICYIHGHTAGGTNPSLVEAMSLNLNIIAYKNDYNLNTTQNYASYFENINELSEIIHKRLFVNGDKMKRISDENYKWEIIANKYLEVLEM